MWYAYVHIYGMHVCTLSVYMWVDLIVCMSHACAACACNCAIANCGSQPASQPSSYYSKYHLAMNAMIDMISESQFSTSTATHEKSRAIKF